MSPTLSGLCISLSRCFIQHSRLLRSAMAKTQWLWITQQIHKSVNSGNNVNKIVDNHASQDSKAKLGWSAVALLLSLQCLNRSCGMAHNPSKVESSLSRSTLDGPSAKAGVGGASHRLVGSFVLSNQQKPSKKNENSPTRPSGQAWVSTTTSSRERNICAPFGRKCADTKV